MKCRSLSPQKKLPAFSGLLLVIVTIVFVIGCAANYHPYTYTGFSADLKRTTGISNLPTGYKDPPVLDANDPLAKLRFGESAKDYLRGVVNDLDEVSEKADNAAKKIRALVDAVNLGLEYFYAPHVWSVVIPSRESNFGILGYPEFSDFDHFPPTKPLKPLFLDNELSVDFYNARVRRYNNEVADFAATVKAYIEDAEHYIANCKNDHAEIRQKGLSLIRYVESLGMDVDESVLNAPPYALQRSYVEPQTYNNGLQPEPQPERPAKVPDSPRKIRGYKLKIDASGEPVKDKDGSFIFVPVYEDGQQK